MPFFLSSNYIYKWLKQKPPFVLYTYSFNELSHYLLLFWKITYAYCLKASLFLFTEDVNMELFVVVVLLVASVYGGYLPPPDYGNETPTCACDEARVSSLMDRVANLESEQQRMRSDITDPKLNLRSKWFTATYIYILNYY